MEDVAKSRLTAWIGRQHRRIEYVGWLSSRQPDPALRSITPRLRSRVLLFGYHALHGRLGTARHVLPPPIAKVCAIRWHARRHGLRYFVETGTYLGNTTAAVAGLFDKCWAIELSTELYERARRRFAGTNVECVQGDSGASLRKVVADLPGPALFWLDAHASGGITADAGYDPVYAELDAIFPASARLVVLIDDAGGHAIDVLCRNTGAGYGCILKNNILRLAPGPRAE